MSMAPSRFAFLLLLVQLGTLICAATDQVQVAPSPRRQASPAQPQSLLNYCIDSRHHKPAPGPEPHLHDACAPWRPNSCCTVNTSLGVHAMQLYNFNFSHCSRPLSDSCRRHFVHEHCFFECSPNSGPWMVKVAMKTRRERLLHAPLCRSFCVDWFEACRNDLTCTDNWMRNFKWHGGSNHCPAQAKCRSFASVYVTAERFCETVWDQAWRVVPDKQSCLQPWFQPGIDGANPNVQVAQQRVRQLQAQLAATATVPRADHVTITWLSLPVWLVARAVAGSWW